MALTATIIADFTQVEVIINGLSGTNYNFFHFTVVHEASYGGGEAIYDGTVITTSTNVFTLPIPILVGGTTYFIQIEVIDSGTGDEEDIVTYFTVPNAVSPPSNITPAYYPEIKYQGQSGSCVAQCLSSGMEFFRLRGLQDQSASTTEYYGASYLYGSDNDPTVEEMQFLDALNLAKTVGTPRWELVGTTKDKANNILKANAVSLYNSRSQISSISNNAIRNSIGNYSKVSSFYNGTAMYNALNNYGCLMFNFNLPANFEFDTGSDGIMPDPDNGTGNWTGEGHCMLILGIKTINGEKYYIAQNSWGEYFGDDGYVYIPYNWGYGVDPPDTSISGNNGNAPAWVLSVYALQANSYVSDSIPNKPIISSATRSTDTATISWTNGSFVLPYIYDTNAQGYYPTSTSAYDVYGTVVSSPATIYLPDATNGYQVGLLTYNTSTYRLSEFSDFYSIRGARPSNFAWTSTVAQGASVPTIDNGNNTYTAKFLTAAEWNAFIDKINEFFNYIGSSYRISNTAKVPAGWPMLRSTVNGIRNDMTNFGAELIIPLPAAVVQGDTIAAAFFNGLKDSLNSIV